MALGSATVVTCFLATVGLNGINNYGEDFCLQLCCPFAQEIEYALD